MTRVVIPDPDQRRDLTVFAERCLRLDRTAVIRLRTRSDGLIGAWASTGVDVLACRVVRAELEPSDFTCAADRLYRGLTGDAEDVDTGEPMDAAWSTALPPETGFVHLDDVPATVLTELARRGPELTLDQQVLTVSGAGIEAGVPMRCVLALTAMGFIGGVGDRAEDEVVRVRATAGWLRIDARFGSVFRRRGGPVLLV